MFVHVTKPFSSVCSGGKKQYSAPYAILPQNTYNLYDTVHCPPFTKVRFLVQTGGNVY